MNRADSTKRILIRPYQDSNKTPTPCYLAAHTRVAGGHCAGLGGLGCWDCQRGWAETVLEQESGSAPSVGDRCGAGGDHRSQRLNLGLRRAIRSEERRRGKEGRK